MAIKIYGNEIVFPDDSKQTTAFTGSVEDVYTKEQIDEQQEAQDVEIAKKIDDAPDDGETYARNNKTWVGISDSSGIPDAPVDGVMYGRKDGDWNPVADAGDIYTKEEIDAQQSTQDDAIQANTDAIADLPTPVDTYTKAEIDASQDAQDVEIAKKANTSDTYTKAATDTLLDSKANVGDSYTKAETYSSVEVDGKLFEKADKTTTYTKTEVDNSQDAQDTNISNNTSAIGTLSGRVSANEQDIATLQDGIFFSSSYTANYPESVNRNPQSGNICLQKSSEFTYSYADANQLFISKTDEQGNVRQFTAVQPNDILVLNQVESPNYGRYKVMTVNDMGDYVNIIVIFELGEGTILEGDTIALQAFPASAGGGGDSIWTEVDGIATYDGAIKANGSGTFAGVNLGADADSGSNLGYSPVNDTTVYNANAGHTWYLNGSTKLVLDKTGDGNGQFRVADLASTTNSNPANVYANSAGKLFMSTATPSSGGIPEAPIDGKQYGRQDAEWTEVTGGGEAQLPVAFNTLLTSSQTISPATKTTILYDDVKLDTDSNYNSTTGKYTISSDGIYRIGASVNLKKNNVLIDALAYLNINSEAPQRNRFDYDASTGTSSSFMAVNIDYVADLKQGDEVSISAYGRTTDDSDLELIGGIDAGNVFNIIKVSGGASSGGGTAEPMVWENKTAERAYDTVYTNTKDCPIYVQPYLERNSTDRMYVQFKIDGDLVWTEGGEAVSFSSPMFVVPSGSTYELEDTVTGTSLKEWFEANVSGGSASGGGTGGDSIWTEEDGVAVYDGDGMEVSVNGNEAMKITTSGELYYQLRDGSTTFRLLEDGRVWFPKVKDTITENPPNLFINSAGELIKSTATTYSTEEVDKRLAIKDKLIEKLSARLDELELKFKALK